MPPPRQQDRLRLAIVVQRYGEEINGGAELHARYIAERLSRYATVRVLTTCARDYVTWQNAYPPGETIVRGIPVERFPVTRERQVVEFGRHSTRVFTRRHSIRDELAWLDSEGPVSPALLARIDRSPDEFDFVLVFSVRYHQAWHAARRLSSRVILVPTMEREASVALGIFAPVLRGVRAIMYNSLEEQAMIRALAQNDHVPGVVVGIGSEVPERASASRARHKFDLRNPFVLYVGRIDENKGCAELFELFAWYLRTRSATSPDTVLDLVLIGTPVLPIPDDPRVRHLGFVSDEDKFDVLAAATALIMPSYYESLSMVALEAWALGRPVLANAHCDVLLGQCLRSGAGLYYEDAMDFAGALDALLERPGLATALGAQGREYYARHYAWPVIERKYLDMFARLRERPPTHRMEPLPGPIARYRRNLPPAAEVLRGLPGGPVREARELQPS